MSDLPFQKLHALYPWLQGSQEEITLQIARSMLAHRRSEQLEVWRDLQTGRQHLYILSARAENLESYVLIREDITGILSLRYESVWKKRMKYIGAVLETDPPRSETDAFILQQASKILKRKISYKMLYDLTLSFEAWQGRYQYETAPKMTCTLLAKLNLGQRSQTLQLSPFQALYRLGNSERLKDWETFVASTRKGAAP